jgi:bacterioferritin-associated ferredoxin
MRDLSEKLGVATQCGKCGRCARGVLQESLGQRDADIPRSDAA